MFNLDVLICCHSKDDYHDQLLERALSSLEQQTFQDFRTILILDECHPETMNRLNDYPYMEWRKSDRLQIFQRPRKLGLASAKNFGLSQCQAEWIAYQDADDSCLPIRLEMQMDAISKDSDIDFCFTEVWDVYNPGYQELWKPNCFRVGQYQYPNQIKLQLMKENCLCHGSAMIRKKSLDELGGYDTNESFLGKEDWRLWLCASAKGCLFYKIPERLYLYSMGTSVER